MLRNPCSLWGSPTKRTKSKVETYAKRNDDVSVCINFRLQLFVQNCDHLPPPPTHTFLKRPFLTDFKKHTHTPPYGTKF